MSFVAEDDEQNKDQSQIDANGLGGAPTGGKDQSQTDISLGGGGSGTVSAGGSSPAPQGKPSSSGSWTNLQSYLAANSDQAGKMGGDIAGAVGTQAQTAKGDVDSAATEFGNQVKAGIVAADPDQVNSAIGSATGLKAGQSLNPDDVSAFQRQLNASYGGPTDFTKQAGYGQAVSDIDKANRSIDQTRSEAGRDVLLQNQYKNASQNGYTKGEQDLDQMLLENSPNSQQAFKGVQDQWAGLSKSLGDATAAQGGVVQGAIQTDQQTATAAKAALEKSNAEFQAKLNANLERIKAENPAAYNKVLDDIKINNVSPDELAALGLSNGQHTYGIDPTKYVNAGMDPTIYNTASADNYAQSAALAQLGGGGAVSQLPSAYASEAGKGLTPYRFDMDRFSSDAAGEKAALENQQRDLVRSFYHGHDPSSAADPFPQVLDLNISNYGHHGGTPDYSLDQLNSFKSQWDEIQKLLGAGINVTPTAIPTPQRTPEYYSPTNQGAERI